MILEPTISLDLHYTILVNLSGERVFDVYIYEDIIQHLQSRIHPLHWNNQHTVKPVFNGHSQTDKTNIFMTNGSLMKVESIAECSPWSILQYF